MGEDTARKKAGESPAVCVLSKRLPVLKGSTPQVGKYEIGIARDLGVSINQSAHTAPKEIMAARDERGLTQYTFPW